MTTLAAKRRKREQSEPPSEPRATESAASETAKATETTALQTVLLEMRRMREEQARRDEEIAATLRRQDEELQLLRGSRSQPQLSPSNNRSCGDVANNDFRARTGFKLKPDIFDGKVPLREFLSQFLLIARANNWDDSTKTIALAASLRGKARTVLENVENFESLSFPELKSKLELLFGEGNLTQNYYSLFTNRKQKFREDLASFGAELERLSRLAYPECPFAVRDKIACAQFVSALSDNFLRRKNTIRGNNLTEFGCRESKGG